MKSLGRVQRGIARRLLFGPATTLELLEWCFPRQVNCRDRYRRKNMTRAIRRAAEQLAQRVERRWPDGWIWRAL